MLLGPISPISWTSPSQEADMLLGPISPSSQRVAVMDISKLLFMDKQVIAYQRPTFQPDLMGFLTPLGYMVSHEIMDESFIITESFDIGCSLYAKEES